MRAFLSLILVLCVLTLVRESGAFPFEVFIAVTNCSGWATKLGRYPDYWPCTNLVSTGNIIIPSRVCLNIPLRDFNPLHQANTSYFVDTTGIHTFDSVDCSGADTPLSASNTVSVDNGIFNVSFMDIQLGSDKTTAALVVSYNYAQQGCRGEILSSNFYYFRTTTGPNSQFPVMCDQYTGTSYTLNGSTIVRKDYNNKAGDCFDDQYHYNVLLNSSVIGTIGTCEGASLFLNFTDYVVIHPPVNNLFFIPCVLFGLLAGALIPFILEWDHPLSITSVVFFAIPGAIFLLYFSLQDCLYFQGNAEVCFSPPVWTRYVGAFLTCVSASYLLIVFYDIFGVHITVFDLETNTTTKIRRFRSWVPCRAEKSRVIVSWRWDISNPEEYSVSATLRKVFERARNLGFRFVLVDVLTLDQKSVDARAVWYFTRQYRTLPVIVGVESQDDLERYSRRFWTNFEMLLYMKNRAVYTLSEKDLLERPATRFSTTLDIISSDAVAATYNLDRLRVFFIEFPFAYLFFWWPLRIIERAQRQRLDLDIDTVFRHLKFALVFRRLMRPRCFKYLRVMPFLYFLFVFLMSPVFPVISPCWGRYRFNMRKYIGVNIGFLIQMVMCILGAFFMMEFVLSDPFSWAYSNPSFYGFIVAVVLWSIAPFVGVVTAIAISSVLLARDLQHSLRGPSAKLAVFGGGVDDGISPGIGSDDVEHGGPIIPADGEEEEEAAKREFGMDPIVHGEGACVCVDVALHRGHVPT